MLQPVNPSEAGAVQLFQDVDGTAPAPKNCTGEGGDYNTFLQRRVMLYNCLDKTTANPNGVHMRVAPQPWGPWGAPQTIFNPQRDRGTCFFIHHAVTAAIRHAINSAVPAVKTPKAAPTDPGWQAATPTS